ncbi:unnamed protein product [Didymodactylos carnosus]|uniref:Peptidase S1 domain-containing protein n=1 Tax=Didymodactylos carnosus TaxID=1234261 RepID=A0A8S2FRT0_9BILA|nr:unnamed protein product [Didymodactylos carnosus]CAF4317676.1 unnamed protein product [Didymodactylos carnosus]
MILKLLVLFFCYLIVVDSKRENLAMFSDKARLKLVIEYWTPERMSQAKPFLPSNSQIRSVLRQSESNQAALRGEMQVAIKGAMPSAEFFNQSQLLLKDITARSTVGRVFFKMGSIDYRCTGSVVASNGKNLVLTAAFCIYDSDDSGWATDMVFVPRYSDGAAPFGIWTAKSLIISNSWITNKNQNAGIGMMLLSPISGLHVQEIVGAQGLSINAPLRASTYAFGYSSDRNNGQLMVYCNGTTEASTYSGFNGARLLCGMDNSGYGSPIVQQYDVNNAIGYQTYVYVFRLSNSPNYIYGAKFDTNFKRMYDMYNGKQNAAIHEIFLDSSGVNTHINLSLLAVIILLFYSYSSFEPT